MAMDGPDVDGGLLLVDKPAGITSHDAVARVRKALSVRKVGHAGTLDPMATGLLVIGVGRGTRLLRFLGDFPKLYEGTGILGVETTTLDADGDVVRESSLRVSERELRAAVAGFVGEIEQIPPAFSAVKVGGERLYRAAREGRAVEAPPRRVTVYAFTVRRFDWPRFEFRVRCGGGTYVRSLVADVGTALGCGAHLAALRRTAIGPFDVSDARPPDEPGSPLPLETAVRHLAAITLHPDEARAAVHGSCLGPAGIPGPYRALDPDGHLIGIYRDDGAKAVPEVILAPA
jgi:tRNA pseudouridine55 synthase